LLLPMFLPDVPDTCYFKAPAVMPSIKLLWNIT